MKNFVLTLFLLVFVFACNNPSNPELKFNSDSIEILNFPDILLSRTGINSIDWSKDYNFDKLNKKIYNYITEESISQPNLEIIIYLEREDSYGNKTFEKLSLGEINIREVNKYNDYTHWRNQNDIEELAKDHLVKYWLAK